jgi:anti-anti-sigma factor
MSFNICCAEVANYVVITAMESKIGTANSAGFINSVKFSLKPSHKLIILNLENVVKIESSCIAKLLHLKAGLESKGHKLVLVNVNSEIRPMLQIARLAQSIFQVYETPIQAITSHEAGL